MSNAGQQALQAALAALQQGRLDESSRLLDRVLRSVPRSVDALHLKSMVSKQSGDAPGAEAGRGAHLQQPRHVE